jgi:hypothetical protein
MGNCMRLARAYLVVIAVLAAMMCGQEASDNGTAAAIRALERQWTVGQARNDDRALDLIFDNALVYVEYGHLVTKGEYLSRIKEQRSELDQITMGPMNVRTFENTCIVVGSYTEAQLKGRGSTLQRWNFVDTWVYKKNGWVLVAAGAAPVLK